MAEFVHLHLHTDYSLLDSTVHISWAKLADKAERRARTDLVTVAVAHHSPAVALTDTNALGGAVEFYRALSAVGIHPVIGTELRVRPAPEHPGFPLVLLARDGTGYRNLCRLVSEANGPGLLNPGVTEEFLAAHAEGLAALSGGAKGKPASVFLNGGAAAAGRELGKMNELFGRDHYFLEVWDHGLPEEKRLNRELLAEARGLGIKPVAANDVRFLKKEHAESLGILRAIRERTDAPEKQNPEYSFKSPEEMEALFGTEIPDACRNTLFVAEQCGFRFDFTKNNYPEYPLPEGETGIGMLRRLCAEGCARRFGKEYASHEADSIRERAEYELSVIGKTGYAGYFLIVQDFVNEAKRMGIPVGPGRGSGAGSLVAYLTGITNVDPLRWNLLFERFLNPERVSPPDFDIDFCERRRSEVIARVTEKYGSDRVAQIAAAGTLKAKAVLRDVSRVLKTPPAVSDRMAKLIPNDPSATLTKVYAKVPPFRALADGDASAGKLYRESLPLEGLTRSMGIHAAGVIVGNGPLADMVPLGTGAHGETVVQYSAPCCEDLGLLKMDFLGLRTLTVIDDAARNIAKRSGVPFDPETIPLDDRAAFDLINRGDTTAVFQLESAGMQSLCRQFVVESVENIIALIAIYRPGPMEFIPDFLARRKGEAPVEYDSPLLEPILRETCGIMLYQEQIMEVLRRIAGFTLGHADVVRRAIAKKKSDAMAKEREAFLRGASETNGIDAETAGRIWSKIEKFAGYGFNKSHSAAYGILSYRTAWLKANHPAEYLAAVLTSELGNPERLVFLTGYCADRGIPVLPPDVNRSGADFSVDGKAIRFGLAAIRGFGSNIAEGILRARNAGGDFRSVPDLLERAEEEIQRRSFETLVRAGALDGFGWRRSSLLAAAGELCGAASARRRDRMSGQGSLFDLAGGGEGAGETVPPDMPELEPSEMLRDEKSLLGFYVSGHPARRYALLAEACATEKASNVRDLAVNTRLRLGGVIADLTEKTGRRTGRPYAVFRLEDLSGTADCAADERTSETFRTLLRNGTGVLVSGTVKSSGGPAPCVAVSEMTLLEEAPAKYMELLRLEIPSANRDLLPRLRSLLEAHPGEIPVMLSVLLPSGRSAEIALPDHRIAPSGGLLEEIRRLSGEIRIRPVPRPETGGKKQFQGE